MSKNDLKLPTTQDMVNALPSASPFKSEAPSVNIFDMSVWKEPSSDNNAVLLGYIHDLHSKGKSPEDIAHLSGLPLTVVRRKLNMVVNSHLGRVDMNARNGKRLEVDELLTERLALLNRQLLKCYEVQQDKKGNVIEINLDTVNNLNKQINDLLKIRMRLWHLEVQDYEPSKPSSKGTVSVTQNNHYGELSNKASTTLGNVISGLNIEDD